MWAVLVACGKDTSKPPPAKPPVRVPEVDCKTLVPEAMRTSLGVPHKFVEMLSATPPLAERPQLSCKFTPSAAAETPSLTVTMNCLPQPATAAALAELHVVGAANLEHEGCVIAVHGEGLAPDDPTLLVEVHAALVERAR
jgi:hypothetical protein